MHLIGLYVSTPLALSGWKIAGFIGIAKDVLAAVDEIRAALAVVGYYVPAVTAFADAIDAEEGREEDTLAFWKKCVSERRGELASLDIGRDDSDVKVVLQFADSLLEDETAPADWMQGVERLMRTPLPLSATVSASAKGLSHYLSVASETAVLDAGVQQSVDEREERDNLRFRSADYGLALFWSDKTTTV